ncbi:MAG: methyltransferase [Prevotella sp.]|nr:methyltransferase [Prevotella sp.]
MFRFKQFTIHQDRCAMKVGTDGVLLGAWAEGGSNILDIGTGTGLIACMMAQRFPDARVQAIEIDEAACQQAKENISASPFSERIFITNTSLQEYITTPSDGTRKFDSVVCNPPYFVNALKAPDAQRNLARHADTLPFSSLAKGVQALLEEDGVFSMIIPTDSVSAFLQETIFQGLFLTRRFDVKTTPHKAPKRSLLSFRKRFREGDYSEGVETLQDATGNRSEWYMKITDNFYF